MGLGIPYCRRRRRLVVDRLLDQFERRHLLGLLGRDGVDDVELGTGALEIVVEDLEEARRTRIVADLHEQERELIIGLQPIGEIDDDLHARGLIVGRTIREDDGDHLLLGAALLLADDLQRAVEGRAAARIAGREDLGHLVRPAIAEQFHLGAEGDNVDPVSVVLVEHPRDAHDGLLCLFPTGLAGEPLRGITHRTTLVEADHEIVLGCIFLGQGHGRHDCWCVFLVFVVLGVPARLDCTGSARL